MLRIFHFIKHAALITLFAVLTLIMTQSGALCAQIKITNLVFDNSDNIVFVKTTGEISIEGESQNVITKGFLESPKRAYVDITNSILAGESKTYELKNSIFETVKISQFSINPNITRIVFTYKDQNASTNNFNAFMNNKGIVIRYTNSLNKTSKNQVVYSNTPDNERLLFFENAVANLLPSTSAAVSETQKVFEKNNEKLLSQKEYQLQSKFYIHSIQRALSGVMIKGEGNLSLKPTIYLTNPDRMVIDIDDTVVTPSLRNKAYTISQESESELIRIGQNTTATARIVIQGKDAKNYRAVISPDQQNLFIAKKTDIINSNIAETKSTIKSVQKLVADGYEALEFSLTNPIAFSSFEEGGNLYLDFNNVTSIQEAALTSLLKEYEGAKTVKIALDKLRVVLPVKENCLNIQVKMTPDSKTVQAVFKIKTERKPDEEEKTSVISKITEKIKGPSISNLYKVVIDAGHGGTDVGATRAGIYEKNITLSIAKMVEKNLKDKGVQTTMTLDRDKTVSLQERCDISNKIEPDLFVSVHVNSSVNSEIYGVETHWWKDDSLEYAKTVHSHLQKNFTKWQTKDRGLFKSQFYVINHTEAPAILVEIGFISNASERQAIVTQKRQQEIAKAISDGVIEYLKNQGK